MELKATSIRDYIIPMIPILSLEHILIAYVSLIAVLFMITEA